VRPYKCNLCEKSFTQRCSLESHCLKVHGVAHQYEYKQRRSKVLMCKFDSFLLKPYLFDQVSVGDWNELFRILIQPYQSIRIRIEHRIRT
jgi:hypothetical protein